MPISVFVPFLYIAVTTPNFQSTGKMPEDKDFSKMSIFPETEICPASFLPLNAPKCVWWPGSSPDPLGELTALPRPSSLRGKGGSEGRGGEDLNPQCLKCVDANDRVYTDISLKRF